MISVRIAALTDLAEGSATKFDLGEDQVVAVVRIDDQVYVIGDVCSHANVSLSGGEVDEAECTLECPKHGSEFDLRSGEPTSLPATKPVPVYEVKIVDGDVYVELSHE